MLEEYVCSRRQGSRPSHCSRPREQPLFLCEESSSRIFVSIVSVSSPQTLAAVKRVFWLYDPPAADHRVSCRATEIAFLALSSGFFLARIFVVRLFEGLRGLEIEARF